MQVPIIEQVAEWQSRPLDAVYPIVYLDGIVIRKAIKKRKLFSTDGSAKKVFYLAIQDACKRWTMTIRNWKPALNRFMIEFEDRLVDCI